MHIATGQRFSSALTQKRAGRFSAPLCCCRGLLGFVDALHDNPRPEDDPRRDERDLFSFSAFHAVFLLCACYVNITCAKGDRKSRRISLTKRRKRAGIFDVFFAYGGSYFELLLFMAVQDLNRSAWGFQRIFVYSCDFFTHPLGEGGRASDLIFPHALNTAATSVSNRFAVFTPAGSGPRSQIANNAATGGDGKTAQISVENTRFL